ncbi:MAG TPA: SURF1 family protein [Casimicrobiaceae bacterium]|nr:SURF1 family protein [Casimicrobiaceae bacterium]
MPNPIGSFFARWRFRPTPWPTLGLAVVVSATVGLGNWQRHRGAEKEALREQYELAAHQPALELTAASADVAALRFRPVRASGEFDRRRQVLIDNKVRAGRPGFDVLTPLKLSSEDRYVLVDRGWIAQGANHSELPQVPPPVGEIRVEGRINLPPAHYLELKPDTAPGPVRQNLDIARIAAATGLPLLPFIIEQTGDAGDGLVRDWPPPDFGIDQHRGYMVQWYSLAGLGIVLWLALNWRARESRVAKSPSQPTRVVSASAGSSPRPKGRRMLLLLALVALSPIVAAYVAYYGFAPTKRVNYGALLEAGPAPAIAGKYADGRPFALGELHGKWVLLVVSGTDCGEACRRALHATRVARTIQGREQDRVVRAWLQPAAAPPPAGELLAREPGLVAASAAPNELTGLPIDPGGGASILLLDPRGNMVLRYGDDPDIERLAKDLERLLRASQIG